MIALERRNKIKELLFTERAVKVTDLARMFDVSEETIRRDLTQLENEGIAHRNYGGAVLVEEIDSVLNLQPPMHQRQTQLFEEKDAIGKKASELVEPNQVVFVDAGSTTWRVSRHLKTISGLTVVTNGTTVASELAQSQDAVIFMISGQLNRRSMSVAGPKAEAEIQKYSANIAFLGTAGMAINKGFCSSDIYEAEVKKAMVASADRVVVVADHTKFARPGLLVFATFPQIDVLVTSSLADPKVLEKIAHLGVEVVVADICHPNS